MCSSWAHLDQAIVPDTLLTMLNGVLFQMYMACLKAVRKENKLTRQETQRNLSSVPCVPEPSSS